MNDIANKHNPLPSLWLPLAVLALSTAAFQLELPAKVARGLHHARPIQQKILENDALHDDPAMLLMRTEQRSAFAPVRKG